MNFFPIILLFWNCLCNPLFINNRIESSKDGLTYLSPLKTLQEAFQKLNSFPSDSLFLATSSNSYTLEGNIRISSKLTISSFDENNIASLQMKNDGSFLIDAELLLIGVRIEMECSYSEINYVFKINVNGKLIFNKTEVKGLQECHGLQNFIFGIKCDVLLLNSYFSDIKLNHMHKELFTLEEKSTLLLKNSSFFIISMAFGLIRLDHYDSLIEIYNTSFSKVIMNKDSLITAGSSSILITFCKFNEINFNSTPLITISDLSFLHRLKISDSSFERNFGKSKTLLLESTNHKINISLININFFENSIDGGFENSLLYFDQTANPTKDCTLFVANLTSFGNFGGIFQTSSCQSIFIDGLFIHQNGWRRNQISKNGYTTIVIRNSEEVKMRNILIDSSFNPFDIAGMIFHLYSNFFPISNLQKRYDNGDKIEYNFENIVFFNCSSINANLWVTGSAMHLVMEAPVTINFTNLKFLSNKNDMGRVCMEIYCNFLTDIIWLNLVADRNQAQKDGQCLAINKVRKGLFLNSNFSNHIPFDYQRNSLNFAMSSIGGAIKIDSSSIFFENCMFFNNMAFEAGAMSIIDNDLNDMRIELKNSYFKSHEGSMAGVIKVFNIYHALSIVIEGCIFENNIVLTNGAILYLDFNIIGSTINITKNIFKDNQANRGGVVFFRHENFKAFFLQNICFNNMVWDFNMISSLAYGSVVFISPDTKSLILSSNNAYRNNTSKYKAGVIYVAKGYFEEINSTFENNSAMESAGNILVQNFGTLLIRNCLFKSAQSSKGGVLQVLENSKISIDGCLFLENSGFSKAGSLLIEDHYYFNVSNSIFENNDAYEGGSIYIDSAFSLIFLMNCSFLRMDQQKSLIKIFASEGLYILNATLLNVNCNFIYAFESGSIFLYNSSFRNMKCINQYLGCIIDIDAVNVTLSDNGFYQIEVSKFNSMVDVRNSKNVTLKNMNILFLTGLSKGSCLFSSQSNVFIVNAKFTSIEQGCIYLFDSYSTINSSIFDIQEVNATRGVSDQGSIIIVEKSFSSSIFNCTFYGNPQPLTLYGGAINLNKGRKNVVFEIKSSFFYNNRASEGGGAIFISNQDVEIKGCLFYGNSANAGGAISFMTTIIEEGYSFFESNRFISNKAMEKGGAFFFKEKIPQLSLNEFENNTSIFGPNYASFPYKFHVKVFRSNGRSSNLNESYLIFDSFRNASTNQIDIDIPSGQNSNLVINADILDVYGQKIASLNDGFGRIFALESNATLSTKAYNENMKNKNEFRYLYNQTGVSITGELENKNINGSFTFLNPIFFATPTTLIPIHISNDALDQRISNISDTDQNYRIIDRKLGMIIKIKLSECTSGEIYNKKQNFCYPCPEDKYSFNPFDEDCKKCPKNTKCLGKDVLVLNKGFWRENNHSSEIYECVLNKHACLGGKNSDCQVGYEGPLCSLCKKENENDNRIYTKMGLKCIECPNEALNVILLFFFVVVFLYFVKYLIKINIDNNSKIFFCKSKDQTIAPSASLYLKILIDYAQLMAITQNIPRNSPDYFKEYINVQVNSIFYIFNVISFDCFIKTQTDMKENSALFIRIFFITLLPIVIVIFNHTYWNIVHIRIFKEDQSKEEIFNKSVCSLVITLFILQPIILDSMLKLFNCSQINNSYKATIELTMDCYNTEQIFFVILFAIPNTLIFCFGYPIYCCFQITKNKNNLKNSNLIMKYGFLYNGYDLKYFYWGFIKIFHKTILIIIAMLPLEIAIKILIIIFILILTVALKKAAQAYIHKELNNLEYNSYITALVSLVMSLYFLMSNDRIMEIFSFLVVLLWNIWFIFLWATSFYRSKRGNEFRKLAPVMVKMHHNNDPI